MISRRYACLLPLILHAACGGAGTTPPDSGGKNTSATTSTTAPPNKTAEAPPPKDAPPAPVEPDVPSGARAARDAELRKQAEGIVAAFTNRSAWLTPDKKKYVFISDRDGLPQLYVGETDKPEAPPMRLVKSTERVAGPALTPDGKTVIFISDKGANERWSIFRVGIDGKDLVELTPGGGDFQRSMPVIPEKAATPRMVYTEHLASESKVSVVVHELAPGAKPKVVYTDLKFGYFVDVTRDGKYAAFVQVTSGSENRMNILDLETGTLRLLYPTDGRKLEVQDLTFSPDGKRAILTTDEGGDRTILIALDVATGKETARLVEDKPATATIAIGSFSKDGRHSVEIVNAGNHVELRLLDTTTLKKVRDIELPLGAGGPGHFSEDGKSFTVSWGTGNAPVDLYLADVATGKVKPLRKDPRPGVSNLPPLDISITEMTSFDGLKIPLNIFMPGGLEKSPKPTPVIVSVHGGPAGSSLVVWDAFRRFYASQGYVIVEPNVRGSSGFGRSFEMADDGPKRENGIKDLEAVARWVMEKPWADKDKMVIFGGSYGGYSVLMGLTRQSTIWRAGIDLVGISNWHSFMKSTSGPIRQLFLTEIGDPEKDAALLTALSPLKDAASIRAPLFVYQGANDVRVPKPESDQMVRVLRERKVPVEYMVALDEGHSVDRKETKLEFLSRSARFIEEALKAK